ncbi:hypothetical protein L1887_56839 [Cichorium endivia]|nr:hypothetical protein L1887_56839 [Cichorium endivia]
MSDSRRIFPLHLAFGEKKESVGPWVASWLSSFSPLRSHHRLGHQAGCAPCRLRRQCCQLHQAAQMRFDDSSETTFPWCKARRSLVTSSYANSRRTRTSNRTCLPWGQQLAQDGSLRTGFAGSEALGSLIGCIGTLYATFEQVQSTRPNSQMEDSDPLQAQPASTEAKEQSADPYYRVSHIATLCLRALRNALAGCARGAIDLVQSIRQRGASLDQSDSLPHPQRSRHALAGTRGHPDALEPHHGERRSAAAHVAPASS